MFGDRPALSPEQVFYQRMLADDPVEAADKAGQFLKKGTLANYYDEVALRGHFLAQADYSRGSLNDTRVADIERSVFELTEDLPELDFGDELDRSLSEPEAKATYELIREKARETLPVLKTGDPAQISIFSVGAQSALDHSATHLFRDLCQKHGLEVRQLDRSVLSGSYQMDIDQPTHAIVCLSYLDVSKHAHMKLATRRLKRRIPQVRVILGCWSSQLNKGELDQIRKDTGSDFVVSNLSDAVRTCIDIANGLTKQR